MTTFDEAKQTASEALARMYDHPYYLKAMAYCYEHDMERDDQLLAVMHQMAFKEYMEQSKPYTDILLKYANLSLEAPEETKSLIEEILAMIAKRCWLEVRK